MDAEHPPVNYRSQAEIIKHVAAVPPDIARTVLAHALVVESIDLSDLTRLVVPSDEGDAVRVADLEEEQEEECLDGVEATVDKVAYIGSALQRSFIDRWVPHRATKKCLCSPMNT